MEPRPHERGNAGVVSWPVWITWRFNGATSSRTWKLYVGSSEVTPCQFASMEPRPHERGNVQAAYDALAALLASMEPRPHERGNAVTVGDFHFFAVSFNGATSSRTWKLGKSPPHSSQVSWLQWSHVLTNVETLDGEEVPEEEDESFNGATSSRTWKPRLIPFKPAARYELQWSHVLTNVETSARRSHSPKVFAGFNGATSSRTWKRPPAPSRRQRAPPLQWSHVLTNVET